MYYFFRIRAPDANDPQRWAARMSGVYGFNYDQNKFTRTTLLAWPIDSREELIDNLRADDIEFISFEVSDLDSFLEI